MVIRRLFVIWVVVLLATDVCAQFFDNYTLGIAKHVRLYTGNVGYDPGNGGFTLDISGEKEFEKRSIRPGIETGIHPIAPYMGGKLGLYRTYLLKSGKTQIQAGVHARGGVLLFRRTPMFMMGFGYETGLFYSISGKLLGLNLLLDCSSAPAYADYSSSNTFLISGLELRLIL